MAVESSGWLRASSVICQSGGTINSLIATTCGQTFVSDQFMNWGAPTSSGGLGDAITSPLAVGQALNTTASGATGGSGNEQITISSNMMLERADNTAFAWDSTLGGMVTPTTTADLAPNEVVNTFAGHFDESGAANGSTGDALLGAMVSSGAPQPESQMTFAFSQALYGIAFQVSSATGTNSNFIATLSTYDGSGNLIGIYQVNTNGANNGGSCLGLANPISWLGQSDPSPCNTAPVVQFYDPEGHVKSAVLTVNDPRGMYVDGMYLDVGNDPSTPDPQPWLLIGGGLVVVGLLAKRLNLRRNLGRAVPLRKAAPQVLPAICPPPRVGSQSA